jgi:hypothetical protein
MLGLASETAVAVAHELYHVKQPRRPLVEENSESLPTLPINVFVLGRGFMAGAQSQGPRLVIDRLILRRGLEVDVFRSTSPFVQAALDRP